MEPTPPFQSSVIIPTRRQLILMPDTNQAYNTLAANKISMQPTNRSSENPKTIFEHSAAVQPPNFKTLTMPIKKQLSQTSTGNVYGRTPNTRLQTNLRKELSNYKLLLTSFKAPQVN
jgi:hypothetical protein